MAKKDDGLSAEQLKGYRDLGLITGTGLTGLGAVSTYLESSARKGKGPLRGARYDKIAALGPGGKTALALGLGGLGTAAYMHYKYRKKKKKND